MSIHKHKLTFHLMSQTGGQKKAFVSCQLIFLLAFILDTSNISGGNATKFVYSC